MPTPNEIDDSWKEWIRLNRSRGCDIDGIFRILVDHGFDYDQVRDELGCEPTKPLDQIENPLAGENQTDDSFLDGTTDPEGPRVVLGNALQVQTDEAEIFVVEDFLNATECDQLIELIRSKLRASTIVTPNNEDPNFRTSRTCDLCNLGDELVKDVDQRICKYLGINPTYSEGIQGQYYNVGEEFKAHTDAFGESELESQDRGQGQRTFTCMVYLNDVEKGGGTRFVNLDHTEVPKAGKLLIWNNLGADNRENSFTMHHGMPVESGFKAVITKWFRENGPGEMFMREPHENLPVHTERGFEMGNIPGDLLEEIKSFYRDNYGSMDTETVREISSKESEQASRLLELPAELKQRIHDELQPSMEEWSGVKLKPTFVYGIREYSRGATLDVHRDRYVTHTISAILNIDQDVEEDWPLHIDDHYYRRHQVNMKPGELVYYEGCKLAHGRPEPLKGDKFSNIFVHYQPVD